MAEATRLYLATGKGVYAAERGGARPLGLQDRGLVRWLLADRDDPRRIYAATDRAGVWRSDDGGETWAEKNEGLVYKQAFCLFQHTRTKSLYVGTEPAAVFRSDDAGETWTELDGLRRLGTRADWTFPGPPFVPHVKCLSLPEDDADLIFGAVEEGWVIRSKDGGASWTNIREGTEFDAHTVTVLPGAPRVVLSTSGKGVYRSADGGETFAEATDGIEHRYLTHVALHPARPEVLFTAGAEVPPPYWGRPGGAGAGFYRSDDAGLTWKRLTGGLPERVEAAPRAVAADPDDPDTVYVGLHDGDIWATRDGGETFSRIHRGLPPVMGICVGRG